jgi:hypothetical protein
MKVSNTGRAMSIPKSTDDGVRKRLNDEVLPSTSFIVEDPDVPEMEGVVDAFYPRPPGGGAQHLKSADEDLAYAIWGWNEQARTRAQEERIRAETINTRKK